MKHENSRKQVGLHWIMIGLLLIAAALFLASYNLCDDLRAARTAEETLRQLEKAMPAEVPTESEADQTPLLRDKQTVLPDYVLFPHIEMPVKTINGIDCIGVLQLPSLELVLPVISEWSYSDLKVAPCRYSGSVYLNNMVICGHNYSAHFGNLKELQDGDAATFTDMDGNVFSYKLVERETLNPTDIEEMAHGDWDLTLFTCTVGGQSRLAFRFTQEED